MYDEIMSLIVDNLRANKQLKERNMLIQGNLNKTVKIVQDSIKNLETAVKEREDSRIYFEHYKDKVGYLEKGQGAAGK